MTEIIIRGRANEQSTHRISAQIVDDNGDPVDVGDLTEATLTLWDLETGDGGSPSAGVINNRDEQDILPTGSPYILNDVTYLADGYFEWMMQPEDNIIVNDRRQIERHRGLLIFQWGTGEFRCQVEIEVVNFRKGS